jgi:hypothetical protein
MEEDTGTEERSTHEAHQHSLVMGAFLSLGDSRCTKTKLEPEIEFHFPQEP